jgi:thymidine kinase
MVCKDGTCGPFTKRIVPDKQLELIGGSDMYIAVCRNHLYSDEFTHSDMWWAGR